MVERSFFVERNKNFLGDFLRVREVKTDSWYFIGVDKQIRQGGKSGAG